MDCPYRGSHRGVVPLLLDAVGLCSLIAFGMLQPGARSCDGLSGKTRRELISLGVWVVIDELRHVVMS